jgi:hypothetical protein
VTNASSHNNGYFMFLLSLGDVRREGTNGGSTP